MKKAMFRTTVRGSREGLLDYEEMIEWQTNEVSTFGRLGTVALLCKQPCTARQLKAELVGQLNIRKRNITQFGLFQGTIGSPTGALREDAVILPDEKLCFQRWNVSPESEARVTKSDDEVVHLLFCEASFYLKQGKLRPTADQQIQLDCYSDPDATFERLYLDVARTVPGYGSFVAKGAVLRRDLFSNEGHLPEGTVVTCEAALDRLWLRAKEKHVEWHWGLVKRWRTPKDEWLELEVLLKQQNASNLTWIYLETPQAHFMSAAMYNICLQFTKEIQKQKQQASPLAFRKPLAKKLLKI